MKVKLVSRKSLEFRNILRQVIGSRPGYGRRLCVKALLSAENSTLAVAYWSTGRIAGAMSYRVENSRWIKRINTGALVRRKGVGTALLRFVAAKYPNHKMWSKNTLQGSKWIRKNGGKFVKRIKGLSKHVVSCESILKNATH